MRTSGRQRRAARIAALALTVPLAASCAAGAGQSGTSHPGMDGSPTLLSGAAGGSTAGGGAVVRLGTRRTSAAGTVLSSGTGYTLYWFGADSAGSSACGTLCAAQWPPLTGVPRAAAGVLLPGALGTITRPDGSVQASYDGHPLYTFAGDFDPGDVGGDGVVQFGGTWHAARPGAAAPAG